MEPQEGRGAWIAHHASQFMAARILVKKGAIQKGMKKLATISAAAFLLAASLAFAGALSAREHKGPRIEIGQDRYDFGKIVEGEQAVHIFEFRNTGDEVLEIQKIQTS